MAVKAACKEKYGMAGPLTGVRVLDLTSVLMGPFATQIMGDLGADVIKVEPTAGDTTRGIGPCRSPGMGSNFIQLNRSKRSLVLDLKTARGRDALLRLARTADVFVHNVRPQAMARLGLGYDEVRAENPGIVYCSLTGFGEGGRYAGQPAYDDLVQGLSALPSLHAGATGEPRYVPTPVVDRVAGLNAALAVSAALVWRAASGEGQAVEVPMFETMTQVVLGDHMFGRTFEPPLGPAGYNRLMSPDRRPYRTRDGWICVLTYTDRHWLSFFALIGRDDLAADPRFADMRRRNQHIDELYGLLAAAMLERTTGDWLAALGEADIPAGPLHDLDSLIADPHLADTGFFEVVEHPSEGAIRSMRVPSRWSRTAPEVTRLAPRLGEHGPGILAEAGFTRAEIEALAADGVTVLPEPTARPEPA